ncbi:hypothetical protein NDU88_003736 [Pleurodeles waltl]|uniref:Uncharacterized protein n=1 Tax=Pleurodeles waltl TaxID=8319 RepID=A0AAV7LG46_PLEWA|nr:hypothetical protein NDU88_003736 [Pleurodeles waltl]
MNLTLFSRILGAFVLSWLTGSSIFSRSTANSQLRARLPCLENIRHPGARHKRWKKSWGGLALLEELEGEYCSLKNHLGVGKNETSTLDCQKMIHSLLRDYAALDGSDDDSDSET